MQVFHVFMGTLHSSTLWDIMKTQMIENLKGCLNYSYFIFVICKTKFFWLSPLSIGMGSACHLGVLLDVPCLGVAKNLFHIENDIDRNEEHMEQVHYIISHFRWYMYNIFSNIFFKIPVLIGCTQYCKYILFGGNSTLCILESVLFYLLC